MWLHNYMNCKTPLMNCTTMKRHTTIWIFHTWTHCRECYQASTKGARMAIHLSGHKGCMHHQIHFVRDACIVKFILYAMHASSNSFCVRCMHHQIHFARIRRANEPVTPLTLSCDWLCSRSNWLIKYVVMRLHNSITDTKIRTYVRTYIHTSKCGPQYSSLHTTNFEG